MAISNKNVTEGIVRALFGAASGAHLTGLAAANQSSGSVALAGSLAQSAPMILGVDLTDNADFIDHFLTNLGLEADSDEMDAATAWATGQINAGASRGAIVSGAVTFLLGLTDATSPYLAVATAFSTSITASVAWSEGDGKAVLAVTDLQAYIEGGQFTLAAGLEAKVAADEAVSDAVAAAEAEDAATLTSDLSDAVNDAVTAVDDIVDGWSDAASARAKTALINLATINLEQAVSDAEDDLAAAVDAIVVDTGSVAKAITAIKRVITATEAVTDAAAAVTAAEAAADTARDEAAVYFAAFAIEGDDSEANYLETDADGVKVLNAAATADGIADAMTGESDAVVTAYLASLQVLADALNAVTAAQEKETAADALLAARLVVLNSYNAGFWDGETDEFSEEVQNYINALDVLAAAEDELAALPAALEAYADAVAAEKEFDALVTAADEAASALTLNGFIVVDLEVGAQEDATVDSDLYFAAGLSAEESAEITGFGADGEDKIYLSTDLVLGGATDNISKLEVFLEQSGDDVVVTIENETYAYSTATVTDECVITLVGVDVADLVFANGVLTLG